MSASERLKALDEALSEYRRIMATEDDSGVLALGLSNELLIESWKGPKRLAAALPELIAVVEAADIFLTKRKKRARLVYDEEHELENALAALDTKLTTKGEQ